MRGLAALRRATAAAAAPSRAALARPGCARLLPRRRRASALAEASPEALAVAPLDLTDDEQMFRDAAEAFAKAEIAPLVSEMDKDSKMNEALLGKLFENGFMGVEIDEAHGGSGASFTAMRFGRAKLHSAFKRRCAVFGAGRGAAAGLHVDIPRAAERVERTTIDGRRRSSGRAHWMVWAHGLSGVARGDAAGRDVDIPRARPIGRRSTAF